MWRISNWFLWLWFCWDVCHLALKKGVLSVKFAIMGNCRVVVSCANLTCMWHSMHTRATRHNCRFTHFWCCLIIFLLYLFQNFFFFLAAPTPKAWLRPICDIAYVIGYMIICFLIDVYCAMLYRTCPLLCATRWTFYLWLSSLFFCWNIKIVGGMRVKVRVACVWEALRLSHRYDIV